MSRRHPAALPSHEALSRLARNDPQSFETLRLELIESCINSARATNQLRLRQLQFRIDGIRQRSRSALGAVIGIQKLMWESFLRMNDELQALQAQTRDASSLAENLGPGKTVPQRCAQIIEIRTRQPRVPLAEHP